MLFFQRFDDHEKRKHCEMGQIGHAKKHDAKRFKDFYQLALQWFQQ